MDAPRWSRTALTAVQGVIQQRPTSFYDLSHLSQMRGLNWVWRGKFACLFKKEKNMATGFDGSEASRWKTDPTIQLQDLKGCTDINHFEKCTKATIHSKFWCKLLKINCMGNQTIFLFFFNSLNRGRTNIRNVFFFLLLSNHGGFDLKGVW